MRMPLRYTAAATRADGVQERGGNTCRSRPPCSRRACGPNPSTATPVPRGTRHPLKRASSAHRRTAPAHAITAFHVGQPTDSTTSARSCELTHDHHTPRIYRSATSVRIAWPAVFADASLFFQLASAFHVDHGTHAQPSPFDRFRVPRGTRLTPHQPRAWPSHEAASSSPTNHG